VTVPSIVVDQKVVVAPFSMKLKGLNHGLKVCFPAKKRACFKGTFWLGHLEKFLGETPLLPEWAQS